jgi:ABC-2 type transport system permease protein
LVAAREIRERVRGRVFRVGTAVVLLVVAAAIIIPAVKSGPAAPQRVGVVGQLPAHTRSAIVAAGPALGTTVHVVDEQSAAAADADLKAGHVDLVIVDARELVVNKPIESNDTSATAKLVRVLSVALGAQQAYQSAGLSASQAEQIAKAQPVPVRSLQPRTQSTTRTTSIIGVILIFVMLTQYLTWILVGVMEEKANRVVEVLLAALRPLQLLTGKVLGIGLVAMGQAALVVAFALVIAKVVGSDILHGTAPTEIAAALLWLVLGYSFYCWVYAAAGSTVERQEQIQSLAFPLSLPILASYIIGITAASSGDVSILDRVLAYLPPSAPFLMPILVGLGAVTWVGFVASVAITIASTVGIARFAGGVYRRSILRTGKRISIREALSHQSRL